MKATLIHCFNFITKTDNSCYNTIGDVLPRVKITCVWVCFFVYQLAVLQCYDFLRENTCFLRRTKRYKLSFFCVCYYISFRFSLKMACVKKIKLDENAKYEKLTLQHKLEINKRLDSRENVTQILKQDKSKQRKKILNIRKVE